MLMRGAATAALVESLLRRGSDTDKQEAAAAIERLAAVPTDPGFVLNESHCCACERCWPAPTATRPRTATIGIATPPWRHHLDSRGISPGPRRCRNGSAMPTAPYRNKTTSVTRGSSSQK